LTYFVRVPCHDAVPTGEREDIPMSTPQTILLGAIAGFTIFLGLPVGRMRTAGIRFKTFLSGVSAGVLAFLVVEIFEHAFHEVEETLERAHAGEGSWGRFAEMTAVYAIGMAAGLLVLFYVMRALKPKPPQSIGPGAMAMSELDHPHVKRKEALQLGMSIAVAIGLHNFSEGLAIGQSAHRGDTTLALLLVIGFALHNATEGFGIVGPLAGAAPPSVGPHDYPAELHGELIAHPRRPLEVHEGHPDRFFLLERDEQVGVGCGDRRSERLQDAFLGVIDHRIQADRPLNRLQLAP
jgi:zinc transporter ZupT